MDQKTIAWVSYLTLIGWIIALVSYNGAPAAERSSLAHFHLRQSFGIMVTGIALYIAIIFLIFIIPFVFFLLPFIWIVIIIFIILGIIAAVNGEEKPLPIVGEFYQKTFTFIS
ncbi:MAG: hypothetical protein QM726_03450 [Chitinophagaceae bacterium]